MPLLAVTPIPNQVDEVNLLFDIEVKQSERLESSMELNAGASGKLGAFKVGIIGSVSAHQTHTRSTDNSAKYHVDIRGANHGMPEGLAGVLDIHYVKLVAIGCMDPGVPLEEQARAEQEALPNRCLTEYPQGVIIGKDVAVGRYLLGGHELVMEVFAITGFMDILHVE